MNERDEDKCSYQIDKERIEAEIQKQADRIALVRTFRGFINYLEIHSKVDFLDGFEGEEIRVPVRFEDKIFMSDEKLLAVIVFTRTEEGNMRPTSYGLGLYDTFNDELIEPIVEIDDFSDDEHYATVLMHGHYKAKDATFGLIAAMSDL